MANTVYLNRFKVRYLKNTTDHWTSKEIATTHVLAKDTAEAIQFVSCLPGFIELRAIDFDYVSNY
jgi:hypothetical protein